MAAPLVSDDLWTIIEPLLPPEPPKPRGGRPAVPSRAALTGILFVLRSGIPWEMLPAEMGCGSGVTCWRRLRDWQEAGVWDRLHRELLRRLRGADRIDWSRACVDSASIPAKRGGGAVGPNPTDRGKPGTKRHPATDRRGTPLAFLLTGANVHDSAPFEDLLDAVPPVSGRPGRPRRRPEKAHGKRPMATKPTTTGAAAMRAAVAASSRASPAAGSRAAEGWAGTGGSSNARWLG